MTVRADAAADPPVVACQGAGLGGLARAAVVALWGWFTTVVGWSTVYALYERIAASVRVRPRRAANPPSTPARSPDDDPLAGWLAGWQLARLPFSLSLSLLYLDGRVWRTDRTRSRNRERDARGSAVSMPTGAVQFAPIA